MQTIIIDDEQPAINILSSFVNKVPFLNLQLATTNAYEGLQQLNSTTIDLLFLDVEMPDITGLELLKSLNKKPQVVLTTAYEKYALDGYELDVLDYLVKPIRFERFLKAANKAHHWHQLPLQPSKENTEALIIKVNYKNVRVSFTDILYIEGLKDYIKIYTPQGRFLTRLNLKAVFEKLPKGQFIRVHRSFIVNETKITAFQKGQLFLDKLSIPVGTSYQEALLQRLSDNT